MSFFSPFVRLTVPSIDVQTVFDKTSENGFIILDVRTPQEHTNARIPGSILLPLDVIEKDIERVVSDKNINIYVHCNTGMRSSHATKILRNKGYINAFNISGGIFAWRNAGYPVEEN